MMNDTELRRTYAALLDSRRSDTTANGAAGAQGEVPLEWMLALVEGRGSEAERLATLDLALANPASARELELLRSIAATHRMDDARRSWRVAAPYLAAAAAIVLIAIPARDALRRAESDPMRDVVQAPVLVSPPEDATLEESRTFRWRSVAGARTYAFEILTATGTLEFTTRTSDTTVTLPRDVQLGPKIEHRWWVASELTDGTQRRSPFRRLQVRAPK